MNGLTAGVLSGWMMLAVNDICLSVYAFYQTTFSVLTKKFSEKAKRPLSNDYTISSDVSCFHHVLLKIWPEYVSYKRPCQAC